MTATGRRRPAAASGGATPRRGVVGANEPAPRNRPVPSARIASAESDAFVYVADNVPRPGVGSNVSQPWPGEPGLDPGVRVVIGHRPRAVLPRPAREADGDAGRNPEVAQHQRHRPGELLAVAELRPLEEVDERRRPDRARRVLVVAEPAVRAQPALDRDRRLVRATAPSRSAGWPPATSARTPTAAGRGRRRRSPTTAAARVRGRRRPARSSGRRRGSAPATRGYAAAT